MLRSIIIPLHFQHLDLLCFSKLRRIVTDLSVSMDPDLIFRHRLDPADPALLLVKNQYFLPLTHIMIPRRQMKICCPVSFDPIAEHHDIPFQSDPSCMSLSGTGGQTASCPVLSRETGHGPEPAADPVLSPAHGLLFPVDHDCIMCFRTPDISS